MRGWLLDADSSESYVSDEYSTRRLLECAAQDGIDLEVITPEMFDLVVTRDDRKSVVVKGEIRPLPDFLIPRMGARTTYYGLAVIRQLERMGVATVNSSESIENVKDKLHTQQILAQSNLAVPRTMLVKHPVSVDLVQAQVGFPLVVKTLSGTRGAGVYLAETPSGFGDLMELIHETRGNTNLILQEFIESSRGRDLRVFVLGGRPVACVERTSTDGGFKANHSRGGKVKPFALTPEIEWLATETARIVGLEIAGIDLLFDGEGYKVCEANSAPGFWSIEECTKVNVPSLIFRYLRIRLGF